MPTVAEDVYRRLRGMLSNGEFEPGQRLAQSRLARELGCSPLPIVEALRRLESDGLVAKDPRKIARVRELSRREVEGLYIVREGLETVGARLCAQRITGEQGEHLSQLGRQFEVAIVQEDEAAFTQLDGAIHAFIAQCADCPLLAGELERMLLIEQTAIANVLRVQTPNTRTSHRAIIQAIIDHDAESAEYLMRKHIQQAWAVATKSSFLR